MTTKKPSTAKKTTSAKTTTTRKTTASRPTKAKKVSGPQVLKRDMASVEQKATTQSVPPIAQTLKKPQVILPIIAIIILGLLAYIFRGEIIVATVNGQPITRFELSNQLDQQYGKQVLESLVTQKLIQQEADKKHVSVSQKEVDDAVKQISDSVSKQGQSLSAVLAARGMTQKDLEDQIRLQKLAEKLLANDIKVSDQDVQTYIDNNKDSLPTGLSDTDLKAQVRQQLEQQKLSEKAQGLIQNLQKNAKINYIVTF